MVAIIFLESSSIKTEIAPGYLWCLCHRFLLSWHKFQHIYNMYQGVERKHITLYVMNLHYVE